MFKENKSICLLSAYKGLKREIWGRQSNRGGSLLSAYKGLKHIF